jgi:hypothetical protein
MAHRHMNVEIGAEAALFPEKEYINRIAVAVYLLVALHSWFFITNVSKGKPKRGSVSTNQKSHIEKRKMTGASQKKPKRCPKTGNPCYKALLHRKNSRKS